MPELGEWPSAERDRQFAQDVRNRGKGWSLQYHHPRSFGTEYMVRYHQARAALGLPRSDGALGIAYLDAGRLPMEAARKDLEVEWVGSRVKRDNDGTPADD